MAKGSHAVWGGWESKVCAFPGCGVKLTVTGGGGFNRPIKGAPWSTCIQHVGWFPGKGSERAE